MNLTILSKDSNDQYSVIMGKYNLNNCNIDENNKTISLDIIIKDASDYSKIKDWFLSIVDQNNVWADNQVAQYKVFLMNINNEKINKVNVYPYKPRIIPRYSNNILKLDCYYDYDKLDPSIKIENSN